ncbi:RBR-type E3 ubiquitin transferase [Trifolium repens]|nr:RBR-type E3 ubiquitin transferase [Trifolium repens]
MHVEKSWGCLHMTCRCGCCFCYGCGGEWSSVHRCKQYTTDHRCAIGIIHFMLGVVATSATSVGGIGVLDICANNLLKCLILGVLFGTRLIIGICFILYQAQRGKLKGLKHELKTGKE